MSLRKISIVLSFLFFSTHFIGQTANEVLKKITQRVNNQESFEYQLKYNLYKGHNSKNIFQSYGGYFQKKSKKRFYLKINQTEFITNDQFSLQINNQEKAIVLGNNTNKLDQNLDINLITSLCKIGHFSKNANGYELNLTPGPYSGLHYSRITLFVDQNFRVTKQLFYYNTALDFSNSHTKQDAELPKLEIIYYNFQNKATGLTLDIDEVVEFKTKRVSLKSKYKKYTIEDRRN